MISIEDLVGLVTSEIPDAEVNVMDKTGMKDHFIIHVTSKIFCGNGSHGKASDGSGNSQSRHAGWEDSRGGN